MDTAQQKTQLIGFVGPFTHPLFHSPKVYHWNSFKLADILWVDGKRAYISILNKYKREDIYHFSTCFMDKDKKSIKSYCGLKMDTKPTCSYIKIE